MNFFDQNWCKLDWSPWIGFNSQQSDWRQLPKSKGLYRIRAVDQDFLMYIGQTGRSLKGRLTYLRRNVLADLMPYNDPHTAAPNLWVWKKEKSWNYECSAAVTQFSKRERLAYEHLLLWKYRLEKFESTLCNFGRFHSDYLKSTNRKRGFRGRRLSQTEVRNPSGGKSHPPLKNFGSPLSLNWMNLVWTDLELFSSSNLRKIPNSSGVYKIIDVNDQKLLYIGQSRNLSNRLRTHHNRFSKKGKVVFSFVSLPNLLDHELKEIENDLIASYYNETKEPPTNQFGIK